MKKGENSQRISKINTAQSFPLRISSVNVTKSTENCGNLITFTEEILNGKILFLCSVSLL